MRMTEQGLKLIMRFEGFRGQAYRDAVGVWTIGYGHTSMAGAPGVKSGMVITRAEAAVVLERDVGMFAQGVAELVKVPIGDAQFSALVSFAYNVGLRNFQKSSVLTAVNNGDFNAVPRRLNLWIKAGGRVLPGLVRRRAAEGAMFASNEDDAVAVVQEISGKPIVANKTAWAATAALLAALWQGLALQTGLAISVGLVVAGATAFIIYDRYRKSKREGI